MKMRVTEKALKSEYSNIYSLPYGKLQEIFSPCNPVYYTAGTYGWKADFYAVNAPYNTVLISRGYGPIGKKIPTEIVSRYESRIRSGEDLDIIRDDFFTEISALSFKK